MHSKKVVHRDIKPSNMVLDEKLDLKICDFGLAKLMQFTSYSCVGTEIYMAPEVYWQKSYTEKCDVYSWAVSFWECFSREMPFSGCILNSVKESDASLRDLKLSDTIHALFLSCTRFDPNERPSMNEVSQKLKVFINKSKQ